MLSLAEEVFVLSLLERKETLRLPASLSLPFSLAGAVLADLIFANYVQLEDGWIVPCANLEQIQDEPVKRALNNIQQVEKLHKLNHWVYFLGMKRKRITKDIVGALVEKGILVEDGANYQWATQEDETALPMHVKYYLKREFRDSFFTRQTVSERMLAVICLMDGSDLLGHLFTPDEMIFVRKKLKSLKRDAHDEARFPGLLEQMDNAIDYAIASVIMK